MLSRGGKAALGLGAMQGAYDLWNADDKAEGLGQAASDILPGAAMYGLTRPGFSANMSAGLQRTGTALRNLSNQTGLTRMAKDINQNAVAPAINKITPSLQAAGQAIRNKIPAGASTAASKLLPNLGRAAGFVGKRLIPGLGAGMSAASALNRWKEGDRLGAVMDAGLGAASFIPGVGGAVNLAGSGLMGLRDSYRNNNPQPSQLPPQSEPRLTPKVSALTQRHGWTRVPDRTQKKHRRNFL
jgi:hypothetical protein